MKKLLLFPVVIIVFGACRKNIQQEIFENDMAANGNTTANVQPVPPYTWKNMTAPPNGNTSNSTLIQSASDIFCVVGSGQAYKFNTGSKIWEYYQAGSFGHFATGQQFFFCYGGKIYFGMNRYPDSIDHRFISNDIGVASYTTLAPFPGTAVNSPTCFVIGDKGYIMGGTNFNGTPVNQLWEYNFATNQWVNKGGSPLGARAGAVAMVVGNKAYIGLGYDHTYFNGAVQKRYKKDWLLYDPASIYFASKASFPGPARAYARGFVLNDVPYIGFGGTYDPVTGFSDFWKYNPSSNTWTEQQSWTGSAPGGPRNMNCFSLGNTGYAVRGSLIEFKKFSNTAF